MNAILCSYLKEAKKQKFPKCYHISYKTQKHEKVKAKKKKKKYMEYWR